MKKILTLVLIGLACFAAGIIGIYFAMPSLSPETVEGTRVRLDSLGLLRPDSADLAAMPDSLYHDTTAVDSIRTVDTGSTPEDIIRQLHDSLNTYANLVRNLSSDSSSLAEQVVSLQKQLSETRKKDFDATELSKSLAKLDAKQLGSILAGLEMDTIELLYQKASARERTRLIESMSAEQAARFVRTLVKGPQPEAALDQPATPSEDGDQAPSIQ